MGWLQGEVALITGGGSGLGWALVERFLQEGAQVAVLQRSKAKVDALNEHFGGKVLAIEGDVASYADNVRAVQATVERFGKLENRGQLRTRRQAPIADTIFDLLSDLAIER